MSAVFPGLPPVFMMERALSTDQMDERLNRALAAYLRQQIQAPATAVTDFLSIIIEDARRLQLREVMTDLDRMHAAGERLNAFVTRLIEDTSADRKQNESFDDFHRRLRHDLRTPLNAIIGYGEMLIEDMAEDNDAPLRNDLVKLKQSADVLLGQIDAMVALSHTEEKPLNRDEGLARHVGLVAGVLRTVQPVRPDAIAVRAQKSRILVVDDNASNRDVLERRLTREGHQVVTAENGAVALDLCDRQDLDLILLDLIMPEIGGYEVLQRLKASERTRHIPVIVISALDELDSVIRCIEAGAEDYLPKPFDPILLRARIDSSLEKKWLRDREKQFIADLDREKRISEALLLNILPPSIANRMRAGEVAIADKVAEATILFCDLVGFTSLSGDLSAEQTVDFLGKIFTTFDQLAAEAGVEKIKTIGDAYMAAAGIPEPQADHAFRVASLAPRMLQAVRDVSQATGLDLQARIGIHSGPIVAGVIGTHKFAYDVWGDSVNTASRMESHSMAGRIHVSDATRRALNGRFRFEPRGQIEVKGKGLMETYFLIEQ
jgi:class 3 adenylate cyclase/CheY-like chemotaxis protein